MNKNKQYIKHTESPNLSGGFVGRVGAWVLTAAALLATTEMLHQNVHSAVPTPVGTGQVSHMPIHAESVTARAESGRETARLPEDYDVGLRMPAISGS